jgi:cephalosporin hydroxylase
MGEVFDERILVKRPETEQRKRERYEIKDKEGNVRFFVSVETIFIEDGEHIKALCVENVDGGGKIDILKDIVGLLPEESIVIAESDFMFEIDERCAKIPRPNTLPALAIGLHELGHLTQWRAPSFEDLKFLRYSQDPIMGYFPILRLPDLMKLNQKTHKELPIPREVIDQLLSTIQTLNEINKEIIRIVSELEDVENCIDKQILAWGKSQSSECISDIGNRVWDAMDGTSEPIAQYNAAIVSPYAVRVNDLIKEVDPLIRQHQEIKVRDSDQRDMQVQAYEKIQSLSEPYRKIIDTITNVQGMIESDATLRAYKWLKQIGKQLNIFLNFSVDIDAIVVAAFCGEGEKHIGPQAEAAVSELQGKGKVHQLMDLPLKHSYETSITSAKYLNFFV